MREKLYIVVRSDLSPGLRISQAVHAGHEFAVKFADSFSDWHQKSNVVAVLSAKKKKLERIYEIAKEMDLKVCRFEDMDLEDPFTAIAIAPSEDAEKLCSGMPLA